MLQSTPVWHCHCGWPLGTEIYNTTPWQYNGPFEDDFYRQHLYKWRLTFEDDFGNPVESSDVELN